MISKHVDLVAVIILLLAMAAFTTAERKRGLSGIPHPSAAPIKAILRGGIRCLSPFPLAKP